MRGDRDKAYIRTGFSLGYYCLCVKFGSSGPIANSAYDCGLVLNAMVGFDPEIQLVRELSQLTIVR